MAPVDPGAQGNEQGNTSPSVPGAKASQAPALRLPQGGLAAVFSAAFSTPEGLPGVAEILRDDEFLEALSRTVSFLSDKDRDDGVQSPRRAVQALHRLESVDAVRSVGRSLLLGCAELFANRRLYLELPAPIAGGQPADVAHETRLHRLCTYLTHITNLIQDGASQFQEPTLWKIIDDEFIARIHPPLAQELNQLYRLESGSTTAVLTVFERLDECAQSLETVTGENRQIISLLAGFILRRLTFALNSLKAPEVRSAEDSGLRDRIAEKLAHKLGMEIEQYRTKKSAPLMHLLKEADGEGYGFVKGVFSGFFRLHGDVFRRKNAWSAETAERQSRLIQG